MWGLTLCWTILGEKHVIGAGHPPEYQYSLRMTGAYMLGDNDSDGFLSYHEDIYENGTGSGGCVMTSADSLAIGSLPILHGYIWKAFHGNKLCCLSPIFLC